MDPLQTFFLVVGIIVLLSLFGFLTKQCWIKLWRSFRGYPEPEPPTASLRPAPRGHVVLDGIPLYNGTRRLTASSIDDNNSNYPGRVPLADEPNSFAHDWFQSGVYKNVERADIEYITELGKGWFGKVVEARIKRLNPFNEVTTVIVKQLSEDSSTRDQVRFLHEARVYRDGSDDQDSHVLKLVKFSIEKSPFLLIFEKWPLGDLKEFLRQRVSPDHLRTDSGLLIRMAIDIVKGLVWMEQHGFVHGDLSARNCLVANTAGKVIIGDYGLSPNKYKEDYYWASDFAVPIRWAAPETISCIMDAIIPSKVTAASNVWTFGIVLWEILEMGQRPYPNLSDVQVLDQVITGKTYVLEQPVNPYFSDKFLVKMYKDFMLPCINYDPDTRPTISNVLSALTTPS